MFSIELPMNLSSFFYIDQIEQIFHNFYHKTITTDIYSEDTENVFFLLNNFNHKTIFAGFFFIYSYKSKQRTISSIHCQRHRLRVIHFLYLDNNDYQGLMLIINDWKSFSRNISFQRNSFFLFSSIEMSSDYRIDIN